MDYKELVDAIFDAKEKYRAEHGVEPDKVRLTREIRDSVATWKGDVLGDLAGRIFVEGVEKAVPEILGLKVLQWDAEELAVEATLKSTTQKLAEPADRKNWKPMKF